MARQMILVTFTVVLLAAALLFVIEKRDEDNACRSLNPIQKSLQHC